MTARHHVPSLIVFRHANGRSSLHDYGLDILVHDFIDILYRKVHHLCLAGGHEIVVSSSLVSLLGQQIEALHFCVLHHVRSNFEKLGWTFVIHVSVVVNVVSMLAALHVIKGLAHPIPQHLLSGRGQPEALLGARELVRLDRCSNGAPSAVL